MSEFNDSMNTALYKKEVRAWSRGQVAIMKRNINAMTNKEKMAFVGVIKTKRIKGSRNKSAMQNIKLVNSLKSQLRNRFDMPERVLFPFARHGYFIAEGLGRGHKKGNPRKKIEWYESVFEKGVGELADIVIKHQADAAVKAGANLGLK